MKTAIIIVTYNAEQWLDLCLGSCRQFAKSVPVIVVDNNSSDNTVEYIKKNYSEVVILPQSDNTGFAKGNNIGIKYALARGAESVFLLNPDAEICEQTLEKCQTVLFSDKKLAAVQPIILLPNKEVNSAGNCFHYLGFAEAGGNGWPLEIAKEVVPHLKNHTEPGYLSGAAMLIKVEVLKQVGWFDEFLFIYHEDAEISWRFRLAGWKLGVVEEALAIHHYEFSRSIASIYYMERNRFLIWLAFLKWPTLVLLILPIFFSEALLLAWSLMTGTFFKRIKIYNYLLTREAGDYIISKRQAIKKIRLLSDREFLAFASATIESKNVQSFMTTFVFNPVSKLAWKIIYPLIRW